MKRLAPLALLALFGCGTSAAVQQASEEFHRTIPKCSTETDCRGKMEAAQVWIAQNINWKIQTATPALIQTFGPGNTDALSAAVVTKEPAGAGTWRIVVRIWCNNLFGCFPDPWQAALSFNRYINAVPLSEAAK